MFLRTSIKKIRFFKCFLKLLRRSQWPRGLMSLQVLACRDYGFESSRRLGSLFLVSVVCVFLVVVFT
jgi:hypothetical protein